MQRGSLYLIQDNPLKLQSGSSISRDSSARVRVLRMVQRDQRSQLRRLAKAHVVRQDATCEVWCVRCGV